MHISFSSVAKPNRNRLADFLARSRTDFDRKHDERLHDTNVSFERFGAILVTSNKTRMNCLQTVYLTIVLTHYVTRASRRSSSYVEPLSIRCLVHSRYIDHTSPTLFTKYHRQDHLLLRGPFHKRCTFHPYV